MMRLRGTVAAFVMVGAFASPAFAQGYVGAFLVGDVVRLDQYDSRSGDSGNGEAFGFGLRLGTEVGRRWGIELEFVRPGEITTDQIPQILPAYYTLTAEPVPPILPNVLDPSLILPSFSYSFRSTQRRTTLSTALWVRQEVSRRFSLAYVGGVAFGRTQSELEISFLPVRPTIIPIPPSVTESVDYGFGPMVGVEGQIRMTDHVRFVPGLRLHGIESGWMIRPALGLTWTF